MKLILDTHAFIWAAIEPGRLSARVADLLMDRSNTVLVSAASAYEIEFKRSRDEQLMGLPLNLRIAVEMMDFAWLPVGPDHAIAAGRLPRLHGDPFDRILVAQALSEHAALVTLDSRLPPYGATTLW